MIYAHHDPGTGCFQATIKMNTECSVTFSAIMLYLFLLYIFKCNFMSVESNHEKLGYIICKPYSISLAIHLYGSL